MASQKRDFESENKNKEIKFKKLEPFLRESLKNKELQVVDYKAAKLLPPGENYASTMLKLDIKFRKTESAEVEKLHLVAKMPFGFDNEKSMVDWSIVFEKELFMYAQLRPSYRDLERDAGIPENELIDVWPEYIGYRKSLESSQIISEDSALLMKNIKAEGFYNCNRKDGLDIQHSRIALVSLARYHALSIAMKQKLPELAKKAVDQACLIGINFQQLDIAYDGVLRTFIENPQLHKHLTVIESSFDLSKGGRAWVKGSTEPWAGINHGDFWTNNILFHKDEEDNVDDVKFVDFQMYLSTSVLKDIPYFLCTSLAKETQMNHIDELISLYYSSFIKHLRLLNCDTSPFTQDFFRLELKKQAFDEFSRCALAIKFFNHANDDENIKIEELLNDIFYTKASDHIIEKFINLVDTYEKIGWFDIS